MKKRILAMLLVLSVLAGLPVMPVYAADEKAENISSATDLCGCGCGQKIEDITWKPWAAKPGSGHYYLSGDYVMEEFNVISGESTVLDLRGYTITTESTTRLFTVNGYLAILDTVGGGRATAKGKYHEVGGVIKVIDNETTGSKFELFSGTITLATGRSTPGAGGLVYTSGGGTFVMHGGVLLEGVSYSNGGCVGVSGSNAAAQILGGQIIGGTASSAGGNISVTSGATLTMKDTTVIGGTSKDKGGNVYVSASTANIENCSIGNGVANHTTTGTKYGGGNICTYSSATLNLTGCEVYGGYALLNGGNICFGNGTHVLKNNKIWGGNCENLGANIYSSLPGAISTIDGGEIAGDVYYSNSPLTLKGALKIGVNATGLVLKQTSKTVNVSGLTSGAEIYVSGNTSKVSGSLTYLKPALDAKLSISGSTVTVKPDDTTWKPYGTTGAAYVYLTEDMADFAEVTVTSDLCIDLRGFDITASGRAFNVASGAKLTIIDSVGGGIVTGSGVANEKGGVITNAGELTIRGGKYVYAAGNTVAGGGIIYTSSALTISGAILDASAFKNTAEGAYGGAILAAEASGNITITGSRILGGSAYAGGGIRMGYNNKATIDACQILNAKAVSSGANVSLSGDSSHTSGFLTMTKTLLSGGEDTTEYAGNFHLSRWGAKLEDCYLRDGKTKEYGGNLSIGIVPTSGLTVVDTVISGGSSKNKGGNIYAAGNSKKVEFVNSLITDGSAVSGGNIYVNNGPFIISGGEVSYGKTTSSGGNIYATTSAGVILADGVMLRNGHAGTYGGNLYVSDKVTLANATFHNGKSDTDQGSDIYLTGADGTLLTFGADQTGDIYLGASSSILSKGENGTVVGNLSMAEGASLNANIYLGGAYDNAAILQVGDTFYTASALIIDSQGERHWFESNAAAVAAAAAGDQLKLYSDNGLVLDKDLYVDLNGHKVTVSGNAKVYGLDSVGDDFSVSTGKLTAETGITVAAETTTQNGNRYLALEEDGGYTFHRIELKITGVTIRPTSAGMYYSAKWACDDVLKAQISAYGVVASTENMPGADFASEEENLYTAFAKDSFVSGETKNGAVISGIMKDDSGASDNNTKGKTDVYAKAYITFENGQTLVSADNIGYSLYDVMTKLDKLIVNKPIQYRKYTNTAREFYETWKNNGMAGWEMTKIPDPGEDGIINVLMIGNSGCYYYVEELHALAAAAGINMRVCNVYYSGCPLEKHYKWWMNGDANYQFYETYYDGRKCTDNMSLESCLAQYEWDFITLQEGGSTMSEDGADAYFVKSQKYWEPLLDYLIEQFPNAQIGWKENVGRQVVHQKEGTTMTPEGQQAATDLNQAFSKLIRDYYNVPAGETVIKTVAAAGAWQKVRDNGYDFLMCRLNKTNPVTGVAHAGDGYHDGDIGGGQLLNALVWFETITGISCLDIDYIPEYKTSAVLSEELLGQVRVVKTENGYALDPELVVLLKQCAHEAVVEYGYIAK